MVGLLARAEQPEPRLYGLLDVGLVVLDALTGPPTPLMRIAFEAKALTFAGLAPCLTRCVSCGLAFDDGPLLYNPGAGGVVHGRCGGGDPIEAAQAQALELARRTPLAEQVDTPPPGCSTWILHDHLRWHTGQPLRSRELLASLE